MQPTNDLDQFAMKYGSDKFGARGHTAHYDRFFAPLRRAAIEMLEIGIGGWDDPDGGGESLRMWRDYFPKGTIHGLDLYDKSGVAEGRIHTYRGDQTDPVVLARIVQAIETGALDIVIDNGSHRAEHVIATFLTMFKYVAPGGWYVVEDTRTSHQPGYGGAAGDRGVPMTTMAFFRQFIDGLNWCDVQPKDYRPTEYDETIAGLHFMPNMIFIQKGVNERTAA